MNDNNDLLIDSFINSWRKCMKNNLNIEITFDDGIIHKISDPVEIVVVDEQGIDCYNP